MSYEGPLPDLLSSLRLKHESRWSDMGQPALNWQLGMPLASILWPAGLDPAGLLWGLAKDDRVRLGCSPTPGIHLQTDLSIVEDGWAGLGTSQGCRLQLGQCQWNLQTAQGELQWASRRKR